MNKRQRNRAEKPQNKRTDSRRCAVASGSAGFLKLLAGVVEAERLVVVGLSPEMPCRNMHANRLRAFREALSMATAHGSPFWVFELNDCEWYLARSLEEAKSHYLLTISEDKENVRHARALTDEEMDSLKFWNSESRDPMDYEHWRCDCGAKADETCRWNGTAYEHPHEYPVGHLLMKNVDLMTFRERLAQLVADGQSKPEFFATTEW